LEQGTYIIDKPLGIIYCYTNKLNGKKYIGQTICPQKRKASHKHEALTRKYENHFHRAIRKYGWDVFEYEVLSECEPEHLNEMETYFILEMQTHKTGYNTKICQDTSPATGKKIAAAHKERFDNMTPEEIAAFIEPMRKSNVGRPRTQSQIDAPRLANQRDWIVIDPSGKEYHITNLKRFCDEHGLTPSNMAAVQSGRYKHHQGWKCRKIE
jgi:group I intron endonuclease